METQISKPEDFKDKGFFHKHHLLGALFFLLLLAGVGFAIYQVTPFDANCKALGNCGTVAQETTGCGTKGGCQDDSSQETTQEALEKTYPGTKVYINSKYGFQFNYPEEIKVGQPASNSSLGTYQVPVPGIYVGDMVFVVANTTTLRQEAAAYLAPLEDAAATPAAEDNDDNFEGSIVECSSQIHDNKSAAIKSVTCLGEGGPAFYALIDGPNYDIFVDGYSRGWDIDTDRAPVEEQEVDMILNSFKFLPIE